MVGDHIWKFEPGASYESRSITLAPSIAIRKGEWVAMMNCPLEFKTWFSILSANCCWYMTSKEFSGSSRKKSEFQRKCLSKYCMADSPFENCSSRLSSEANKRFPSSRRERISLSQGFNESGSRNLSPRPST